jgi:ferredoxin
MSIDSPVEPPTSECAAEPGEYVPVIDRERCEGKADCVKVCPNEVFEVRRIDDAEFARLGAFSKLKSMAHGRLTAYTPLASACLACGKCIEACPENAIRLARPVVSWLAGRVGPSLNEQSWSPFSGT